MEQAFCVRVEGADKLWVILDFFSENKEKGKDFGLEEMKAEVEVVAVAAAAVLVDEMSIFSQGLKQTVISVTTEDESGARDKEDRF